MLMISSQDETPQLEKGLESFRARRCGSGQFASGLAAPLASFRPQDALKVSQSLRCLALGSQRLIASWLSEGHVYQTQVSLDLLRSFEKVSSRVSW